MCKVKVLPVVAVVALVLALAGQALAVDITVDDTVTHQTMTGFGTCMPGWMASLAQDPDVQWAYWHDLGASIFRFDMDPAALNPQVCNETVTYLGPNISENIALFNFNINSKGDPCGFGSMAAAANTMALDSFKILGTIWSPPDYMKEGATCQNNESCGGSLIMTSDNLTQFGRYCAAYIKGWGDYWGVPVTYFSPQNEPGMATGYTSCYASPANLPVIVHAARTELDANGINCNIVAPDGPWYISCWDHVQDLFSWISGQRAYGLADLDGWATHFNTDDSASDWDTATAWDVVWNGGIDPVHPTRSYVGLKTDGLQHHWMTEICYQADSWDGACELARGVHNALVIGNCDAYIYWCFTMGDWVDTQGLCEMLNGFDGVPNTSAPKYNAFKHYCRYIRPGAVRIGATPSQSGNVYVSAYKGGSNVTLVVANYGSTAQTANITLNVGGGISSFDAWRSSASERWVSVGPYSVSGGHVSFSVPATSIVTLTGTGTGGNSPPVANNDAYSTDQDVTLNVSAPGVLANDTDADSDPLTAAKMSDPSHGSATLNSNGSFTYTPDSGYSGSDSFTYRANDGEDNSNTATVNITINAPAVQEPYGGTPWAIPGTIEAEDYDTGGEGVAYHDADTSNSGGQYRSEGVDIETCGEGGYNVGWIDTAEWLEYTVNIASTDAYDIEFRVASESAGGNLHLELDGQDVTGTVSFAATGGWQAWTSATAQGVSLTGGQHVLRLYMESASFNVNWMQFTSGGPTVPNAPSSLSATATGTSTVDLSWTDNSSDENGFRIERKTGAGGTYGEIDTVGANVTSYGDTGLSASTTYYYRVRAYNGAGNSAYSNEANATTQTPPDTTPPAAPTGLSATAGEGQVSLDWNNNSEGDLAGYRVYRSTTSGGGYSQIASPGSSAYTDNGVTNGTTYYYVVTAYDTSNNESGYSNEASATPEDTTAPAAPTGLSATAGDGQVTLDWNNNGEGDLDGYRVYRSTTSGSGYSQIASPGSSSYTDSAVTNGTTYYYVVTAYDTSNNESGYSTEASATPQETVYDATIVQASAAPSIDGSIDGVWSSANSYTIANALFGSTGGSDLSGTWRALWDSSNLYYLAEVTDEALQNDSAAVYQDDCVEVYIDANNSKGTSYDGVDDYQLMLRWSDATVHVGANSATDTTGMQFAIAQTAGGYTCELLVPWSTLGVTPAQGNLIGTDVHVNDDDDGGDRDGKIAWFAATDDSWSNPSLFATADLGSAGGPTVPNAPSGLSATATGTTTIDLSWTDNSTDEDGFRIERKTGAGGTYGQIDTVGANVTNYGDSGLSASTTYYYRVLAYNAVGDSGYSNEANATTDTPPDTTPPDPPTGLSATAGEGQVSLDWNNNSEGDLDGYKVYRSTTSGSGYGQIADVSSSAYTDGGVTNGTTYYYVVTAYDTSDNESGYSNEASATPQDVTAPAAPTGLSATAGDASVALDWNNNGEGDLDGYRVYRSTTSGSGYGQIADVSSSAHTDSGVTNGTTYYYVVTAYDTSDNESGYSSEVSATPQSTGLPAPWVSADVGSVGQAGSATYAAGTFTIDGGGADIWGTADGFHFVYQTLSGDGEVQARVASIENTNAWAKAGVMIRAALTGGSTHAMAVVTPGNGVAFQRRTSTDGSSTHTAGSSSTAPRWVRVVRNGSTFTGYESSDGSGWTEIGSATISMGTDVYIGLCVTSHDNSTLCTAQIGSVTVGGGGPDVTPPAAPTGLNASAGDGQVSLDWNDNGEGDLDGYRVYRSTTSGSGYSQMADVSSSAHTDTGLTNGTTYYYVVTAYDTSDNESGYSSEASATPQTGPAAFLQDSGADGIVCFEAENYDANTAQGSHTWTQVTSPSGYSGSAAMASQPDSGTNNNTGYAANSPRLDFQVNFVKTGTHYVWVRGYGPDGSGDSCHAGIDGAESAASDRLNSFTTSYAWHKDTMDGVDATVNVSSTGVHTVNVWMREDGFICDKVLLTTSSSYTPSGTGPAESPRGGGGDTTPPAAPTGLSASAGDGQVSLDWNNNGEGDLDGYRVYRSTTSGSGYSQIASPSSSAYTDNGVSNDTTYYYVVTAYDTSNNESGYSNEASATPQGTGGQAPYGGTPWAIPGTIQAEDYDTGGEGVAYHDESSGNSGGEYRSDDVDIQTCSDTGGGYNVTAVVKDEWLEYTVDVAQAGTYDIEIRVATQDSGRKLRIEFDGVDKTGAIMYGPTGGMQVWDSITATGVSLDAGQHVMRLYLMEWTQNINWIKITSAP